jgi:hypothetical protein
MFIVLIESMTTGGPSLIAVLMDANRMDARWKYFYFYRST